MLSLTCPDFLELSSILIRLLLLASLLLVSLGVDDLGGDLGVDLPCCCPCCGGWGRCIGAAGPPGPPPGCGPPPGGERGRLELLALESRAKGLAEAECLRRSSMADKWGFSSLTKKKDNPLVICLPS